MKKIGLSFEALATIIAVTILQACAAAPTTSTTQCAKPTLTPSLVSGPVQSVKVTIKTATVGAHLRYTLDATTPTSGPSPHGTPIPAASGDVVVPCVFGRTLKAIAYKPGLTDSSIETGKYGY